MAEASRLLVLSDADSWDIVAKLHQLCGDEADAAEEVCVLNLKTKYYNAAVEVHRHQVKDNAPVTNLAHPLHEYEALLCVVDAGRRDSFLHLGRYLKTVVDVVPYDVCLLAAETKTATKESVQKMESWSQDNGFEFVNLDAEGVEGDEDSVIDEKHGVERVLEALQCTMWGSMEMLKPEVEKVESSPETEDGDHLSEKKEESSNQEEDKVDDDSRLQSLLQALESSTGDASDGEEGDGDFDMSEFSALLSQVRNVRDEGQTLTDEQRRERAAEVAMKLWTFLGADDEGSDSD